MKNRANIQRDFAPGRINWRSASDAEGWVRCGWLRDLRASKVAVKLVKRGMDTSEILRRFRMERQVLASLDHPNIARLIDGGSTAEGMPYLAMEYVEGTPIDQFCESHASAITDRLKLFLDVCAAVQYAHQNLVVHRDIKTANILVTQAGVVKLLDFGIAKLLRTDLSTLEMAQTRPEMRPMTLDYASPEQVRGEAITTSTDVYSLGVLLYKLLTGKMPYGVTTRSPDAIRQAILETEPRRPSAVILTDDTYAIPQATQKIEVAMAETRSIARKRLKKKLSGDLDTIILKALRKEPQKRYLSVEQFSGGHSAISGRATGRRAGRHARIPLGEVRSAQHSRRRGNDFAGWDTLRQHDFFRSTGERRQAAIRGSVDCAGAAAASRRSGNRHLGARSRCIRPCEYHLACAA